MRETPAGKSGTPRCTLRLTRAIRSRISTPARDRARRRSARRTQDDRPHAEVDDEPTPPQEVETEQSAHAELALLVDPVRKDRQARARLVERRETLDPDERPFDF